MKRPKHNVLHNALHSHKDLERRACVICGDLFDVLAYRRTQCCSSACRGLLQARQAALSSGSGGPKVS